MTQLPRCDLKTSAPVLRANDWGQAFRITEQGPAYDGTPESIHAIIKWLGVEKGRRWAPKPGTTYCNVYATDLAHACGVYLPRVWWNQSSEVALASGATVNPSYGTTAMELSANSLFKWLAGPHSTTFGWRRTASIAEAQDAANNGRVVVICSRKRSESSPGHIAVIAPETPSVLAPRDGSCAVTLPVTSQAGARNEELGVSSAWWHAADMADWGAWINEPLIPGC